MRIDETKLKPAEPTTNALVEVSEDEAHVSFPTMNREVVLEEFLGRLQAKHREAAQMCFVPISKDFWMRLAEKEVDWIRTAPEAAIRKRLQDRINFEFLNVWDENIYRGLVTRFYDSVVEQLKSRGETFALGSNTEERAAALATNLAGLPFFEGFSAETTLGVARLLLFVAQIQHVWLRSYCLIPQKAAEPVAPRDPNFW